MKNDSFIFGLYGAGGFGREVMPLLRNQVKSNFKDYKINDIFFITSSTDEVVVNGHRVISQDHFLSCRSQCKYFNVAVANSSDRKRLAEECISGGAVPYTIVANSAELFDDVLIAPGAIVCSKTMVTSNVKIGVFFHLNIYSYVAHDCVIGDYVTFAPGVQCNGNVCIEDHVYVGTGAVIKPGSNNKPLVIGEGAIIGMGAVVTKNVDPYSVVFGNPARPK